MRWISSRTAKIVGFRCPVLGDDAQAGGDVQGLHRRRDQCIQARLDLELGTRLCAKPVRRRSQVSG